MARCSWHLAFGPAPDSRAATRGSLRNHLVGAGDQPRRNVEPRRNAREADACRRIICRRFEHRGLGANRQELVGIRLDRSAARYPL